MTTSHPKLFAVQRSEMGETANIGNHNSLHVLHRQAKADE